MRMLVTLVCLGLAALSAGCSPDQGNYSCNPTLGPRSGEFYQFAPTRDADGYYHCGRGY